MQNKKGTNRILNTFKDKRTYRPKYWAKINNYGPNGENASCLNYRKCSKDKFNIDRNV